MTKRLTRVTRDEMNADTIEMPAMMSGQRVPPATVGNAPRIKSGKGEGFRTLLSYTPKLMPIVAPMATTSSTTDAKIRHAFGGPRDLSLFAVRAGADDKDSSGIVVRVCDCNDKICHPSLVITRRFIFCVTRQTREDVVFCETMKETR
jgi:hypothetical protein